MAVSEKIRTQTCAKIESIVTKGIAKIFNFNPPLKFKIEMAVKGNSYHAIFQLEDTRSKTLSTVLDNYGGGLGDIVGIILRLCLLEFQLPKNTAPVFFDECGKFLSCDFQENFAEFLNEWSHTFSRQIILISHRPEVISRASKIIRINKDINSTIG
jgi:DNA repair exonuclease SbcCD ATPase subunit